MFKYLYNILEIPIVYNFSQSILGGAKVYSILKHNIKNILINVRCERVLDVGCGTGAFMDCFSGNYYGIDINSSYIVEMQRKGIDNLLVGDATALPYEDESFDVVFSIGVLHHLPEEMRRKMLEEVARVCKKNGQFILIDGIIPSDRRNIIGYALAKLDRGKYKMRLNDFKYMFNFFSKRNINISFVICKVFPYEYVIVIGRKM